jgi:hypothetical protein
MDIELDSSGNTELSVFSEALIPLIRIPITFEYYSPNSFFFEAYQENVIRERSVETYIKEKYSKKDNIKIALPILEYREEEKENLEHYCTICLYMILLKDLYYRLNCGHCFHNECIEEAVKFQHFECPLCRNRIPYCIEEDGEEEMVVMSSSSSVS